MKNEARSREFKNGRWSLKTSRKISLAVLSLVAVAIFLLLSHRVEASSKFWIASGPGNFNDDANWSLSSGGPANTTAPGPSDSARFDGNGVGNCTITTNVTLQGMNIGSGYSGTITVASGVDLTFGLDSSFQMDGGTFNASNGTLFVNAGEFFGSFVQTGGIFNGDGTIDINCGNVSFDGGIFNATPGTTTFHRTFFRTAGTFNHNNGTVIFTSSPGGGMNLAVAQTFNNLTLNNSGDSFTINGTAEVAGALGLNSGTVDSGTLDAKGAVTVDAAFAGGNGLLSITGADPRTITFAAGSNLPNVTLNAPNVTIETSGSGTLNWRALTLQAGTINQGAVNFAVSGNYNQSGGTFNLSNRDFSVNPGDAGSFIQSGGIFNGNGTIDINCGNVRFDGGTFNATPGNTIFHRTFFRTAGTFNHNNGTVIFTAQPGGGIGLTGPSTQTFKNLTLSNTGDNFSITGTVVVLGALRLVSGLVNSGIIQAQGDVVVEDTFGFGIPATGGTTALTFNGAGNQTFTNNGGAIPTGTWTVNKTTGTLTAATSMTLGTSQALSITGGTLYLNNNSNLTCGALTIGASGRLLNDSSTTITLGANATNNGRLDLQGSGAACPQSDTILLRSSVNGTQRNWSGTGVFALVDVDVQDMGGSSATQPAITVFSGTNSGNNNTNWSFNNSCPPTVSISPQFTSLVVGTTKQFVAGGGSAPFSFSLAVNNSGGSINSSTGLYTAGTTANVTDTVRVTDSFGSTADASALVVGEPNRLAFIVQPKPNSTAGQDLAPSLQTIQIAIQDQFGNVVPTATNAVAIGIQNNVGSGTLSGTTTQNAVNGVASFNNLSINHSGNGYTLQATSGALMAITSMPFNVNPGAAAQLVFVTQPTDTTARETISPSVQVAVRDSLGNTVLTASNIHIAFGNNPGGGTFGGSTPDRFTVNGVATFGLAIGTPGNGYTLVASHAGLSQTSQPFNVTGLFEVTNINNGGSGSLRHAIANVNGLSDPLGGAGTRTITFNIPGAAPHTIAPVNQLPTITRSVIIDGTTQPGFTGVPIVELSGVNIIDGIGLSLMADNNTVKGLVVNGWHMVGVNLDGHGNVVQSNYIGTNASGTSALGNGIGIQSVGSGELIGGAAPSLRNVISGNGFGIKAVGGGPTPSLIQGNFIGTSADGVNPVPNVNGIQTSTGKVVIGGTNSGEENVIAFNSLRGVRPALYSNTTIRGNSIHSNAQLGIDISPFGVNLNDPGDADTGPNGLQNFPVLNLATTNAGTTNIQGVLNSVASSSFILDFYSNSTCDSSGFGEGQTYLGSGNVTTDGSNVGAFNITLPLATTIGQFLTATATDAQGNTSEFSLCRVVTPGVFSISGRAADNANAPLSSSVVQLTGSTKAATATDSNGNYTFNNVPSGGNYAVTITRPNYDFAPPRRTYTNLIANQTNQNYIGTKTRFTVAGSLVSTFNLVTFPLSGVAVTASGTTAKQTTANGVYVLTDLPPGSYVITPSKDGFAFSPSSMIVNITNGDQAVNFTATPSTPPLDGRILFASGNAVGSVNADGTAYQPALLSGSDAYFSRDGRTIRTITGNLVQSFNADGSSNASIPVLLNLAPSQPFAWSPDESKIALQGSNPSGGGIWVVNADGTGLTHVPTSTLTWPQSPSWLSNNQLAFLAWDGHDYEIYSVNINGSGLSQLTSNSVNENLPVASPDGTRIAFERDDPGGPVVMVMHSDGSSAIQVSTRPNSRLLWSPDGTRLAFNQVGTTLRTISVNATGGGLRVIRDPQLQFPKSWGPDYDFPTATGSNVILNAGGVSVTFASVASSGTTTFTPLSPNSVGTAPTSFVLGGAAYEISTTATYVAPIGVCFKVPSTYAPTQTAFNAVSLLHRDGSNLVDITTSRNFNARSICGDATTLSPFVLAEHTSTTNSPNGAGATTIPLPTIVGLVQDDNGNPLADVSVQLTGTETRSAQTDAFGIFQFVNLTADGNYNVQPKQAGYLFNEYSYDFFRLSGESTVVFVGSNAGFSISGKALDVGGNPIANVQVNLEGDTSAQTTTNATGSYSFTQLPADSSFNITAAKGDLNFDPQPAIIGPLTGNQNEVNFTGSEAGPGPTPTPTPTPPNSLTYTALGDSITFGLSDTQGGFTTRYQSDLQTDLSLPVSQINLGVPGATSTDLLNSLQTNLAVRNAVADSQVVTFNIGGNDLLPVIFQYQNAQCGGTDNLDCMRNAMTLLKSNLSAVVAELLQLRATNDTVIRTMDFYNPFVAVLKSGDSWPGDGVNDFQAIKPFADDINNYIVTLAAANKIPCVRVSIAFNGPNNDEDAVTKGLIAADGIHPSTTGHEMIADLLRTAAYEPFATNTNQPHLQFAVGDYAVKENAGLVTISVVRAGNPNLPLKVDYATADGTANQRGDYIASLGRLNFAAGELLKTIPLLIVNDVNNEPDETLTLTLSNPTGGASLIAPTTTNIVITNDDAGVPQPNPLEDARFFAQEHYFDFLNRFPDSSGLDFWTNEITSCGTNQSCLEVKRINVSAAFYLSIEFQETGYLVERIYKTAYGDATGTSALGGTHPISVPTIRLNEFLSDTQQIGLGVVVGQTGWEQVIENNKVAFTTEFVQSSRFTTAFPLSLTPAQFVDQLNINAGNPLSQQQRDQLVNDLTAGTKTRAQVLRAVAEDGDLNSAEFNRAFVLMQYFGYLRRNPNDTPDSDYTGYDFWLTKLTQFAGDFVNAEMVKAFITSGEYRQRFGP
jgi:lysophospholipase L1-like esterase